MSKPDKLCAKTQSRLPSNWHQNCATFCQQWLLEHRLWLIQKKRNENRNEKIRTVNFVGLGRDTYSDCRAVCKKRPRTLTHFLSSDHVDKVLQFLAGIEIYPFARRAHISHTPMFLALNPYQIFMIGVRLFCRASFGEDADPVCFHWNAARYHLKTR